MEPQSWWNREVSNNASRRATGNAMWRSASSICMPVTRIQRRFGGQPPVSAVVDALLLGGLANCATSPMSWTRPPGTAPPIVCADDMTGR